MELLSWRFVAESGPAPVWLKLITSHDYFLALENHIYSISPNNVFKVVDAAVKGVGCDFNGVGTSFKNDADESDAPIPEELVEVYNPIFGHTILLDKVRYYEVLMDYCCELKRYNEGRADENILDGIEAAIKILEKYGVPKKLRFTFPKSWKLFSIQRKNIFGGHESEFLKERFHISLNQDLSIQLGCKSFESLEKLKTIIDAKSFDEIVKSGEFKLSVINTYKSKEDHSVDYYKYALSEEEQYLVIVSFGEKQPTLFQFFVESIWCSV